MRRVLTAQNAVWVLLGLVFGLGTALFLPGQPSYATATDHSDDFAIATGILANDLESVYLLDFKSGRLMGTVLNRQSGKFSHFYERNLANDFGLAARAKPKFMMVTGLVNVATAQVPINNVLYVAEVSSGKMVAYFMPYRGETVRGTTSEELQVLDGVAFRQGLVRPQ
ncbi:MAG: hypothetical protein HY000_42220 [Planctomycetes bacterium]|nr:hypothetical protein [Planctomycetota bacterium]